VHAVPFSDTPAGTLIKNEDLQNICKKLSEQPMKIKEILPIGNVGIGLAWSYFYGYLNLILPEIPNRIESSKHYETNGKKMSRKFFIIIPESGKTPDRFSDIDQRFITEGPLDDGFIKSRAGQPSRLYKNFVQRITGKNQEEDFYFCGEFATPVLALRKMVEAKVINEKESQRQMALFRHTLMAIVNHERNTECNYKANIVSFVDQDNKLSLADQLQEMISSEDDTLMHGIKKLSLASRFSSSGDSSTRGHSGLSGISSIIFIPVLGIISGPDEDGKPWVDGIKNMFEMVYSGQQETFPESETEAKRFAKEEAKEFPKEFAVREYGHFKDLHPRIVDLTVVDEDPREDWACEKLIIILTEDFKDEVEKHADALIANRIWFPRTTFILDLGEVPKWLEATGADYINSRKNDVWTRIFGSMFGTSYVEEPQDENLQEETAGTSSVEREKDERPKKERKENPGGIQYQVDRLPVGNVAEGLAWAYHYNYLALLGPTMAERIKKTEYFSRKLMPSKLFILVPWSCFSHSTLEVADKAITSAGKLETLTIQIAGNNRNYDTAIHKISSQGQTYYACVEYCTPVLVMYEMEAEGKAGLSPGQKEAQLFVFKRVLENIINKSEYKQHIQMICYDDKSTMKLSELLVNNIQKCL